jgi:hypothetical protein
MPDTPEDQDLEASSSESSATSTTPSVSRTPVRPESTWQKWVAPVALLIAVVAVALSIWALMSASSKTSEAAKLPGDPKTRVCTAFNTVSTGASLQTHLDLGQEPVALTAVAGNARLALVGGGQYLASQLDSATPARLADPVRSFANNLQDIGIHALAGEVNTDPDQSQRLAQAETTRKQIVDLCK